MSPAANNGIIEAFRDGLLTSTSLLTNAPAAEDALVAWKTLSQNFAEGQIPSIHKRCSVTDSATVFDLGLHLNLTQGRPLTADFPRELRDPEGNFPGIACLYRKLWGSGHQFEPALCAEIVAQLSWMTDRGITPTHVNGHQYVELIPAVTAALTAVLPKFCIRVVRFPCESGLFASTVLAGQPQDFALGVVKHWHARRYARRMRQQGFHGVNRYFGTVHAGRVTAQCVARWLKSAPPSVAVEIGLHPATRSTDTQPGPWRDPLSALRPAELAMLTSPEFAHLLRSANCRLARLAEVAAEPC